ncbi:MAG: RNA polymerase sigma factor [Fimbriimonadaceae bacterium]|nr:RNA polymerase sigma factor [Fimbriimonadaceae bacterium]NUM39036.1 RNA polymerase sigma factor [Armatimonadota bacterium]
MLRRYGRDVANYVLGFGRVRYEDAEDITADTLVTALELAPTLQPSACVRSWLFAIARLRIADHFRKALALKRPQERNRISSLEEIEGEQYGPLVHDPVPEVIERLHHETVVRSMLAELNSLERTVLIGHYVAGKSIQELAREFGKSPKAMECFVSRAKARARSAAFAADWPCDRIDR